MQYDVIRSTLETYHQMHLLKYYEELDHQEKEHLLHQISMIDFKSLNSILSKKDNPTRGKLSPINTLTAEKIEIHKSTYDQIGIDAIKQGKVGAVILAGGQGTRLGFDKPKGTLNVGLTKNLYLFQIHVQNLLEIVKLTDSWVPLFIMTSEKNNKDTIEFMTENNYFGYNKEYITFFKQEMTPSVDYCGKIYMESKSTLSMSPNGNGGWFSSLVKTINLMDIKSAGIQWFNVFSVDNALQKIADPCFIGATIDSMCVSAAKVVRKAAPEEKVGTLCMEDGKPSIIEYYDMTVEMLNARNADSELLYNYGVILNYLFKIEELEAITKSPLPIHIVEKKIPYLDEQGNYIKPEAANGYKFETLVLDMIHEMTDCLSYEVIRNKEFAPIKNRTGIDSLESARKLLMENGMHL